MPDDIASTARLSGERSPMHTRYLLPLFFLLPLNTYAYVTVVNTDFETGDLSAWNIMDGPATIVTSKPTNTAPSTVVFMTDLEGIADGWGLSSF